MVFVAAFYLVIYQFIEKLERGSDKKKKMCF
jgi:hypothetical protein